MPQHIQKENHYSVKNYMSWNDDNRYELIDGVLYNMIPSPTFRHQRISSKIFSKVNSLLEGINCITLYAPMDVVLSEDTVVQPDIMIICDRSIIKEKFIAGAPEVIFEVISPSTSFKDKQIKLHLYEKYGVKEYFIVYPDEEIVEVYLLKNNKFQFPKIYNWDSVLKVQTVKIELKIWEMFEKELPKEKKIPNNNES